MGLFAPSHGTALHRAQDLWETEQREQAVSLLRRALPTLHPKTNATDALIIATLAVYLSDLGRPREGLALIDRVPLDGVRLTQTHLIVLGARSSCKAAFGDLAGARRDRDTIFSMDPRHPALALTDASLERFTRR